MRQLSSRFSVAVHILTLIAYSPTECTGDFIAGSVNTNPVVIRRIMGQLKKAGLIGVRPGVGGAVLLRRPEDITLLDVYRAVEVVGEDRLFKVHEAPNPRCPVGRSIESALDSELSRAQQALERELGQTTIAKMVENV